MARADKPGIGRRVQIRQPYLPVVQCIINNQHPDPTLDTNSPSPGATSNHLTILVPNPLPTILTGVRRTVDWAFSSRPQSLPIASENSTIVTSNTGVKEILQCMVERRCPDVTSDLSPMTAIPRPYTGGGYGDVYKWSKKDGSIVSIKCLRIYENSESTPKSTKRISRELYHLFRASHPNVLELTGVALFNGQIAIVSPWMKNGNLRKYIRSQPEVDRWSLCIQIAEGLAHIHSIKMVHGDLKAENILVSDQGVVKISDFGNSILEECSLRYTATSRVGGGTSRWMAWELFSDPPADISATTDVHSLGMTLLEVMTGEYPYAEYKGNISVLGPLSEKRLPKRPEAFASHRRWGDERWALLLDCWNVEPNLRPDSLKVLNRMRELQ